MNRCAALSACLPNLMNVPLVQQGAGCLFISNKSADVFQGDRSHEMGNAYRAHKGKGHQQQE
jgi:hypothetical protein